MIIKSDKAQSDKINIVDYIEERLELFGARSRPQGEWIRFPAVWRGSRDYNIAAHPNGTVFDHAAGRKIAIDEIMSLLGGTPDPDLISKAKSSKQDVESSTAARVRFANDKWRDALPLSVDCHASEIAIQYLRNRGIPDSTIERIKPFSRASLAEGPMFITPIISPFTGSIIGVQRAYLDDAGRKREVEDGETKRMVGLAQHRECAGGVLINGDRSRFNRNILAVVEGYETGLAVHAASGMPVYVTYNAGNLERIYLPYLSSLGIEGLVICGDNDKPDWRGVQRGQKATLVLAKRVVEEVGISPLVALPEIMGDDWLDVYVRNAEEAAEALLNPREFDESLELELSNSEPSAVTIGGLLGRRYGK